MKKFLLFTILICTGLVQALAFEWTDDNGVTWTVSQKNYRYDDNGDGYSTDHYFYTITGAANYGDDVVIPQTVYNGATPYTIKAIGNNVFQNNKTLSSVAMPTTIKYIYSGAFFGCQGLATVTGTSNCEYIYSEAFRGCSSLTGIDLSACQTIDSYAFDGCSKLTNIVSVSNCKYFGYCSFRDCPDLQEVDLSDNANIDYFAFARCSSLKRVGSLKGAAIGNNAFQNCSSLESVDISQAKSLGDEVFYECTNLTTVGDLSAYTAIGNNVFGNCKKLKSVNLSNCRSIGSYAFSNCQTLQQVDLSQVKTIDESAFFGCENLEEVGDLSLLTSIPNYLFYGCTKLKNVNLPNVTSIGAYAFGNCSSITNISLPKTTAIGRGAFFNCTNLTSVDLPVCTTLLDADNSSYYVNGHTYHRGVFTLCAALTSINLPMVTSIGSYAFCGCTSMTSINLPQVTTIGNYAFKDCTSLNDPSITSTALSSIGEYAFNSAGTITLMSTTPAALGNSHAFGSLMVVRVPDAAVATYRAADVWSSFANRILGIGTKIDFDVNVSADDIRSTLHETIGEENLQSVISLKVTGSLNSYDIMVMRNKMDNLHYLDLTDANIVANNYEYISGYHTENDVFPANSFSGLSKIVSVKLPKSIKSIGSYAFSGCQSLKEVEFQSGLERIGYNAFSGCQNIKEVKFQKGLKSIGNNAFSGCGNLKTIIMQEGLETIGDQAFSNRGSEEELIIPNGVTTIGKYAFGGNTNLKRVYLPNSLKTIGEGTFNYCSQLESISLPTSLEAIPNYAFQDCSSLTRVDIPSTIKSIGGSAFSGCSKLNDVYTYIVEPTPINMNTFSSYTTATLHVPSTSYYNYWYDTEWSQFRNLDEFIAEYQYFYINNDFTINDEQGTINGGIGEDDPDADLNPGSGLIVETDDSNPQQLDELHIKAKGSDVASVITASNLVANKVYFDIEITAGRWYFLSFPFNVKITDETIQAPGKYVFRTYDAEARADGKTGWANWIGDMLNKGQGYIFQCSKGGTLSVCVEKEQDQNIDWDSEDRSLTLNSAPAANAQDASWNFLGNPQTSYVDIDKTGYDQPITVWNGTGYEAVRSGDDTYALKPFEAFFVQKSDNTSEMEFPESDRLTKIQWEQETSTKAASRRMEGVKIDRQMVNIELSDGEHTDKTRIVFNEKASKDYEAECDAAKFLSSDIPQFYSLDQRQSRYAINERQTGEVRLGYVAKKKGSLTIKASRMDQPMLLRDMKLQITHDLSIGDYSFTTDMGTFNNRFMLVVDGNATSVGKLRQDTGVSALAEEGGISFSGIEGQEVSVYSLSGTMLASHVGNGVLKLPAATYIVKVNNESTKLIVR